MVRIHRTRKRPLLPWCALVTATGLIAAVAGAPSADAAGQIKGIDVSHHNGTVNWKSQYSSGIRFAYVKATEGTTFRDPKFAANYNGSYSAGMIRGAYHFARPGSSSGKAQADYFVAHGGGWSKDGKTLPGALDLEAGCSGLSKSQMVNWISSFTTEYKKKTSRDAVLYTTRSWWQTCTGGSTAFGNTNPMWVADWKVSKPKIPAGWSIYTFWQYTDSPMDHDYFNGNMTRLKALANG